MTSYSDAQTSDTRPPIVPPPQSYEPEPLNPWLIRIPILFVTGVILLGLVLAVFVAAFQMRYLDKIVPGVSSYGLNLSGMTPDEARTLLKSQFTYDRDAVFTLRDGDRFWQMTAAQLGVSFDAQATVDQAFAAGHAGDILTDLFNQASIWLNGRSIPPVVNYDQTIALNRLVALASEINRPAADATLTLNGRTVTTTRSQTGRTLDISATLSRLDSIIMNMDTGAELPLVVNETPPLVWDAESAAARVRLALSGPVTLTADDMTGSPLGPWTATADQIAALLNVALVDNGDGTRSYQVSVSVEAFRNYLNGLAPGLIASPRDARFHFNPTTKQLEVIQPSVSGRELNVDETLKRMEEAIFSPDARAVPMAFDYVLPRYPNDVSAAQLGITELVSQATTYFSGSPANRRTNIATAASRFDGIMIAPGEEFSFNHWVGDISQEEGFVEGLIILGDSNVREVGGGVCQVSTTAFRAAFWAGYPILERYAHSYRVGYYETGDNGDSVGMDAAIYQPDYDFRFQNDTPYHLLIETSIFPGTDAIQFRFYSTNPGRKVVKGSPTITNDSAALPMNIQLKPGERFKIDLESPGTEVRIVRIIQDLSGTELRRETFYSNYRRWSVVPSG